MWQPSWLAVAAFVLLATLSSRSKRIPVALPVRSFTLWNFVPVFVLPLVLALDQVIPERTLGFLTSGFAAAASYITLVSAFFRVVADRLSGRSRADCSQCGPRAATA
jgi:hypothetical protein